ncbi:5-(carboxyamino)imidazole ribonucleotide synthase [Pantoea sp. Mhis]|uniref:5-(carboxyamino)imidazole ribonucleotide synthase n=1 Tax=Pantoea sp. Mhis TaxID=2576759 RepID=UPI00135AD851|nr:5-(carboxyamino)imidazole ribonucleotide synthase [Pantoea sp. Mhis]MXP56258.1 5-(carboxyamino)imidazole ribonucleotide synthase [Pantoea sp. Mhis]
MKSVFVLGDGQLSYMLYLAGKPLDIKVYPISLSDKYIKLPMHADVITTEIESWPSSIFINKLINNPAFINRDIFPILSDRLKQKKILNQLKLATSPWRLLQDKSEWPQILSLLGHPVIVKCRTGGYDGHRQWCLHNYNDTALLEDKYYGQCIVEKKIDFIEEISLIGARNQKGNMVFYPLTCNFHQSGILRTSIVLPKVNRELQQQAENMLSNIMHYIKYIGVMVMECFLTSQGLLINELSPRVHNSGHWTQNGASISQFELHLRAILGLPMPKPIVFSSSVMINLIGTNINFSWLEQPLVHLYWYGKELRAGRKVGHLNLTDINQKRLLNAIHSLTPLLPQEYTSTITWILAKL